MSNHSQFCRSVCGWSIYDAAGVSRSGEADTDAAKGVETIRPLRQPARPAAAERPAGAHKRKADSKLDDRRAADLADATKFMHELSLVSGHFLQ